MWRYGGKAPRCARDNKLAGQLEVDGFRRGLQCSEELGTSTSFYTPVYFVYIVVRESIVGSRCKSISNTKSKQSRIVKALLVNTQDFNLRLYAKEAHRCSQVTSLDSPVQHDFY